ncbi:MAG: terminase small subunit [Burkholderiales bacterium]
MMKHDGAVMKLTPKQEKFCQEIVKGKSQSDAYRKAYATKGMKDKQVHEEACKLKSNPKISQRIEAIRGPVIENLRWSIEDRLKELRYAGQLDPLDLFDEHGQPKPMHEIPEHARRAIAGFEVDAEKFTTKFKMVDKRGAILDYTRLAGDMPAETHKVHVGVTVEHLVELIQKREPKVLNG